MSILRFLGFETAPQSGATADTEAVRKIVESLDHLEPDRARFIAAFAYILSRAANADLRISPEETRAMERQVMEKGALPEEQAIIVVQMAKTRNLMFGGTDNFLVTREFNRIATREQKLALLDCLFAVSAAEGGISNVEDHAIRQIARELLLEHSDYIAVRSRHRGELSIFQSDSEDSE